MKKHSIKVISILIVIFGYIFCLPLFFAFLLAFGTELDEESNIDNIYDGTHYYCDDHYEVYSYSAGAMDSFHYSIGKHYEILTISDTINISYNVRTEKTYDEYKTYLKTHNCKLVGDKDGPK